MDYLITSPAAQCVAPLCGIYRIANSITGDCYIGSSTNIHERWRAHRRHLKARTHHNLRLSHAWLKYGADAFGLSVLELCAASALIAREQTYIDAERPAYNMAPRAGQGPGMAGRKHTLATRTKLSQAVFSAERRAAMRAAHVKRWTPEARQRQSASHRGLRPSRESNAKGAATRTGRTLSEETRNKIGDALRGKVRGPQPADTIQRKRDAQRTRRQRERLEGKPRSEALRRQLAQVHAARRARTQ